MATHFLGIDYPGTQTQDNTEGSCSDQAIVEADYILTDRGGRSVQQDQNVPIGIVPHSRTLRNAREQVKQMVVDGFSTQEIRSYLRLWALGAPAARRPRSEASLRAGKLPALPV